MQTNFSTLQANLSEIYAALYARKEGEDLPLYATSSGILYFQGSWTGQIVKSLDKTWRWLQPTPPHSVEKALQLILKDSFNQAVQQVYSARQWRILNHMRQLNEIFHNNHLTRQNSRYAQYLTQELQGSSEAANPAYLEGLKVRKKNLFSEVEETNHRWLVIHFHQATFLFWSLFVKDKEEWIALRQPLMDDLDASCTLLDRPLFKALKKERKWVQLEGMMQQAIPVALFAKLQDPSSLTVVENRRLKGWIQTLNGCQSSLSPKLFASVLTEIMNVIHLQGSSSLTLQDLLYWLDQQGCEILTEEDPSHMDWRGKLSAEDRMIKKDKIKIECNGKELIVGQQLSLDKLVNDQYQVFELENYPDYVVKIACNRFLLLIEAKKAKNEREHWGVRFVETVENLEIDHQKAVVPGLDQQGRCVVLEKLTSAWTDDGWSSDEIKLTKEDERRALVFANHLFCMSQARASAQNLSLDHLMWDKGGLLKSTRLLKKGPANYLEWESYCEEAAQGNPYVLSFLMHVSKLNKHKIALYYRKAVEHTLKTGKTDLLSRPLPSGHRQDHYTEHLQTLCTQAQHLRINCLKHLVAHLRKKNKSPYKKEGKLQEEVAAKLIEFYQASPTPGRFSSDLKQDVVTSLLNAESKKKSASSDSFDAQAYYQEKHDLMMKYNGAILQGEAVDSDEEQEKEILEDDFFVVDPMIERNKS